MTLSLFDHDPTAAAAAATATSDQPFDPRPGAARARLHAFLPQSGKRYASQRNFDFGPGKHQKVSALSPWLRHRIILETEVLEAVLGAQPRAVWLLSVFAKPTAPATTCSCSATAAASRPPCAASSEAV